MIALVALHHAGRLELGEGEGLDIFLERHAVLQAKRDGDGEVVHHRTEGSAFLVHVDEDLADTAVVEFAGAQVNLVAADDGFLGVALCGGPAAFRGRGRRPRSMMPLDDLLGDRDSLARAPRALASAPRPRPRPHRPRSARAEFERLRQLRAVAVERVGLQRQLPGQRDRRSCSPRRSRRSAC